MGKIISVHAVGLKLPTDAKVCIYTVFWANDLSRQVAQKDLVKFCAALMVLIPMQQSCLFVMTADFDHRGDHIVLAA